MNTPDELLPGFPAEEGKPPAASMPVGEEKGAKMTCDCPKRLHFVLCELMARGLANFGN